MAEHSPEILHPGKAEIRLGFLLRGICPACRKAKLKRGLSTCEACREKAAARARAKAKRRNHDPPAPMDPTPEVSIWDWTETALERAIRQAAHDLAEPI